MLSEFRLRAGDVKEALELAKRATAITGSAGFSLGWSRSRRKSKWKQESREVDSRSRARR